MHREREGGQSGRQTQSAGLEKYPLEFMPRKMELSERQLWGEGVGSRVFTHLWLHLQTLKGWKGNTVTLPLQVSIVSQHQIHLALSQ